MKINKSLLIILTVFISLLAIGAVSASDSDKMTDATELSVIDDDVQTVDVSQNEESVLSDGENGDVQMTVDVKNTTYDDDIAVNVNVADKAGSLNLSQCSVEVFVDDEYITNASISDDGKSAFDLPAGQFDVGTYYLEANLLDGANKKIVTSYTVFNIAKATPIVLVENVTASIGQGVKVPVNVTDRKGKGLSGDAIVTISWQTNSISKYANIVNGSAESSFDMSDMMGGMMNMDWGSMFGGGNSSQNSTMNFNMSEISSMMNGSGGMGPMASGSSAVKFNYFFPVGTYDLNVTFLANRNYNEAKNSTDITVVYYDDVVYVADITSPKSVGDKTIVDIMALDKYGNLMPNIDVTAVLDGSQEVNATLNDYAMARVTFDDVLAGNHKLVIASNATGNITNKTFVFAVNLPKLDTTITAKDKSVVTVNVNVDGKIGKYFSVTLKDATGNVLANKSIQISIDSEKYNLTTNDNGVAKLQINIAKANVYTCAIAFLGDDSYNGAFDIAKVTVKKQSAKLTTKSASYKAKAKTKKLTATFKSAKGNAIKNKKITFKVKGKTYSAKTNSKGVASVKVKLTTKGKFTFTAKFAGDNTYKAISKKAKLTIK